MKNLKMKTKLILGFLVPVVLTIVNMYLNKLAMATALKIKDPVKEASYERNAEIFTTSITVIAIIITVKTWARTNDLKEPEFRNKYLLGTLTSLVLALIIFIVYKSI